jgi:hypothetical protein
VEPERREKEKRKKKKKKKLVKAGLPRGDDNSEIDRALHRHPNPQWGGA